MARFRWRAWSQYGGIGCRDEDWEWMGNGVPRPAKCKVKRDAPGRGLNAGPTAADALRGDRARLPFFQLSATRIAWLYENAPLVQAVLLWWGSSSPASS